MSSNALGKIAFSNPTASSEPRVLSLDAVPSKVSDTRFRLEIWGGSHADGVVRNVWTITINDPVGASVSDGAYYVVTVTDGTTEETYAIKFETGLTIAQLQAKVAAHANLHPAVGTAVGSAGAVTITGRIPGVGLTVTVDCVAEADNAQISGAITVAETVAEAGTPPVLRKMFVSEITMSLAPVTTPAPGSPIPTAALLGEWIRGISSPQASNRIETPNRSPLDLAGLEALT